MSAAKLGRSLPPPVRRPRRPRAMCGHARAAAGMSVARRRTVRVQIRTTSRQQCWISSLLASGGVGADSGAYSAQSARTMKSMSRCCKPAGVPMASVLYQERSVLPAGLRWPPSRKRRSSKRRVAITLARDGPRASSLHRAVDRPSKASRRNRQSPAARTSRPRRCSG